MRKFRFVRYAPTGTDEVIELEALTMKEALQNINVVSLMLEASEQNNNYIIVSELK